MSSPNQDREGDTWRTHEGNNYIRVLSKLRRETTAGLCACVCWPDHILKRHLHCPYRCLPPPCQQPGTGCPPSVLLPISCVLVGLALPVSFSKSEGNETENLESNKNETTLNTPESLRKAHCLDFQVYLYAYKPNTASFSRKKKKIKEQLAVQGRWSLGSRESGRNRGTSVAFSSMSWISSVWRFGVMS